MDREDSKTIAPSSGSNLLNRAAGRLKRDANRWRKKLTGITPTIDVHHLDIGRLHRLRDAETNEVRRPPVLSDDQWRVFQTGFQPITPPSYALELNNAYVVEEDSWILTADGRAILGMWSQQGATSDQQRIAAFDRIGPARLAGAQRLDGTTLVLNQVVAGNFFHFVNQIIPRLKLASEIIALEEIDHFVTPPNTTGFMRDWLSHAGIHSDRIVAMQPSGLVCERLIATNNPGPFNIAPKWACDYLRDLVPVDTPPDAPRRIFVSRVDAPKRRLLNHQQVETELAKHGFEHVLMSGRSAAEQASLFHNAEIIVGVHGAALAHLVFCRPGTKVIELLPNNHLQPCFWTTGQTCALDYEILVGTEKPLSMVKWRRDVGADLTIDIDALISSVSALTA
ncbi:MAG: glycosyltransferase family 61 protein [Pseudomonadota bacterium]